MEGFDSFIAIVYNNEKIDRDGVFLRYPYLYINITY